MDAMPYIVAVVMAILEILSHMHTKELLNRDFPSDDMHKYYASNYGMGFLIVAEVLLFVTGALK